MSPPIPDPLVSLYIPTYNEQDYLPDTLERLSKQSIFRHTEIVLGDYDPENNGLTKKAATDWLKSKKVGPRRLRIVNVDKRGIGYARNQAAKMASSNILMSFDADGYFDRNDAMWRLVSPVINGQCLMSCCLNFLESSREAILPDVAYKLWNLTELSYEPGLTMSKHVYSELGGYPDVPMWEGGLFSGLFLLKYGPSARMQLKDVCVYVSARRMKRVGDKLSLESLLNTFDYNKAYRRGSVQSVH